VHHHDVVTHPFTSLVAEIDVADETRLAELLRPTATREAGVISLGTAVRPELEALAPRPTLGALARRLTRFAVDWGVAGEPGPPESHRRHRLSTRRRPRGVLTHERLRVGEGMLQHRHVLRPPDVAEHHPSLCSGQAPASRFRPRSSARSIGEPVSAALNSGRVTANSSRASARASSPPDTSRGA
jgi:hypothetical protein